MKVVVISDSHGLTAELEEISKRHRDEVEAIFHCGDSELTSNAEELTNFHVVRGNCDFDHSFPKEIEKQMGSTRFYITHGHLYNVKSSLLNLRYRALEIGANIVLFGHSHVAGAEVIDNILFVNPGSIRLPRMSTEKTYAIVDIVDSVNGKDAVVKFYTVAGLEIPSMMVKCKLEERCG